MIRYRAIVKRPDEPIGHVTNVSTSEQNLSVIVDGTPLLVFFTHNEIVFVIVCAEQVKSGAAFNTAVRGDYRFSRFTGTIVALGWDNETKSFTDLPKEISRQVWAEMLNEGADA